MRLYSVAEVRRLDTQASSLMGIPPLILMENAGRGLAELLLNKCSFQKILIICGKGNNGGDGFVAARHLANKGHSIEVLLLNPAAAFKGEALLNYEILKKMKLVIKTLEDVEDELSGYIRSFDAVIDAIFGIGLKDSVNHFYAAVIETINTCAKYIIAADLPSGLHGDTGEVMGCAVKADETGTFAVMKKGLVLGAGPQYAGNVSVIDISIPSLLLQEKSDAV